jgi:RimJ/RimL family protein N-acetyltransferase
MADHAAMLRVFGDAEVMRFGDGAQTAEWVRAWLRGCLASYERHGYGPWAVVAKDSGAAIGYCGLFDFPDVNGRPEVEIGYRLNRACWGQGYATEAVIAVRDYAFDVLGMTRLIAIIDPDNAASIHVAENAGLRHETEVMFEGYSHPDRVYVIEHLSDGSDSSIAVA